MLNELGSAAASAGEGLGVRRMAGSSDQALQAREARTDDLLPPELVTRQL